MHARTADAGVISTWTWLLAIDVTIRCARVNQRFRRVHPLHRWSIQSRGVGGREGNGESRETDGAVAESASTVRERKRHYRQTCGALTRTRIPMHKSMMAGGMISRRESACLFEICAIKWCFYRGAVWHAILDWWGRTLWRGTRKWL